MKSIVFLCYFFSLQVFSCNDMESYRAILNDIKSSEIFIDFVEEKEMCSSLKVLGYLYSMCFLGSPFVFDYPDISDYLNENCFGENVGKTKEYQNLEKLSDTETACFWISFSETLNKKIVVEVVSINKNINKELIYLYEVLSDGTVYRLKEEVFFVD